MNDLHVKIDWRRSFLVRDFFQSFEFVIRMRSAADNCNVCGAAYVSKSDSDKTALIGIHAGSQNQDRKIKDNIELVARDAAIPDQQRLFTIRKCLICATPNSY